MARTKEEIIEEINKYRDMITKLNLNHWSIIKLQKENIIIDDGISIISKRINDLTIRFHWTANMVVISGTIVALNYISYANLELLLKEIQEIYKLVSAVEFGADPIEENYKFNKELNRALIGGTKSR